MLYFQLNINNSFITFLSLGYIHEPTYMWLSCDEHFMMIKMSVCLLVPDISVLTMVSKDLSIYIADYMSTLSWKNKNITQSFHSIGFHSTICHYKHLGKFTDIFVCILLKVCPTL